MEFENSLGNSLQDLERNGKRVIEQFSDFRSEQENLVLNRMQNQLDGLSKEVNKSINDKLNNNMYLVNILEKDIPQLKSDISLELNSRNEIEL